MDNVKELVLYAWVGEDELGSGQVGIKQAMVPAGCIPMVAIDRSKIDKNYIREQLQELADQYGKTRHLVRFVFAEVVSTIEPQK